MIVLMQILRTAIILACFLPAALWAAEEVLFVDDFNDGLSRGFCLSAAGAPKDAEHWVRFDNCRVIKTR